MPSPLDNLVSVGTLKQEPPARSEFDGLVRSGRTRLQDARNSTLALESRFDLAYNAAHALALAALRYRGYRPDQKRYVVFQALPHTLNLVTAKWRVLDEAHRRRNRSEYEGETEVDLAVVEAVIRVASEIEALIMNLQPLPEDP